MVSRQRTIILIIKLLYMSILLKLKKVNLKYKTGKDNISVLNNINLITKKKETVSIIGESGSGKTSLIYAVASHFSMDIAMITFDAKMNDVALMRAIKRAPENSIIVFEDIDVLFKERKDNDTCTGISFSGLLNCLDGICSAHGTNFVLSTDNAERIRVDDSGNVGIGTNNPVSITNHKVVELKIRQLMEGQP